MQDEVTSFPLYVEALKFAFHEDSMIRVAIRTLTLNVYHGKLVSPWCPL
jgi:protein CLEC16A